MAIARRHKIGTRSVVIVNTTIAGAFVHAGAEPSWDLPAIDHEGWSAPRTRVWRLPTHPQETSENSVESAACNVVIQSR